MRTIAHVAREHAVFIGLVGAYFAGAAIYFWALGRWDEWVVLPAYPLWTIAVLIDDRRY